MMTVRETIIASIKQLAFLPVPVTDETGLYTDLAFDSLTFIQLILETEQAFDITINISEIQSCLQVGSFIALVENKRKEKVTHAETIIKEP